MRKLAVTILFLVALSCSAWAAALIIRDWNFTQIYGSVRVTGRLANASDRDIENVTLRFTGYNADGSEIINEAYRHPNFVFAHGESSFDFSLTCEKPVLRGYLEIEAAAYRP